MELPHLPHPIAEPADRDRLQMRLEIVTTMLEKAVEEVRRVMAEIDVPEDGGRS